MFRIASSALCCSSSLPGTLSTSSKKRNITYIQNYILKVAYKFDNGLSSSKEKQSIKSSVKVSKQNQFIIYNTCLMFRETKS
jgi:hypothetical protein